MKAFAFGVALAMFVGAIGTAAAAGQDWPQSQHDAARTGRAVDRGCPAAADREFRGALRRIRRGRSVRFAADTFLQKGLTRLGCPGRLRPSNGGVLVSMFASEHGARDTSIGPRPSVLAAEGAGEAAQTTSETAQAIPARMPKEYDSSAESGKERGEGRPQKGEPDRVAVPACCFYSLLSPALLL